VNSTDQQNNQRSYQQKTAETQHDWYVIDAANQRVGTLAVKIALLLSGKHKPTWTPHCDNGDFVIVINCEQVEFSGSKWTDKIYYRHSGFPGGLKKESPADVLRKHPERIIERAVRGMLPTNRMRDVQLGRLKVFVGAEHTHQAQRPVSQA
jgi:large subunit ribosomal protein L13